MIKERLAFECLRCGWKRFSGTGMEWAAKILDHMEYGEVRNDQLVKLDIRDHNCSQHLAAGLRAETRRGGKPHRLYYKPTYVQEDSRYVE